MATSLMIKIYFTLFNTRAVKIILQLPKLYKVYNHELVFGVLFSKPNTRTGSEETRAQVQV